MEDARRSKQLRKFVQKLGLSETAPVDWALLDLALTHPSISAEANYQQLEFVGDAVVRLVASELLLETYPECPVGEFAAIRSVMVSDRTLAQLAQSYGIERYLLIAGSVANNSAGQASRWADAFEAVLGALYLSTHTMKLVRPWLDPLLKQQAEQIRQDPARQNYKDALQEWTQAHHKVLPQYHVQETGQNYDDPDRFAAEVWLKGQQLGEGKGRSKKAAEQAAAKEAFFNLGT
ncbi:MAG: ribonuclease III [Cyanobacteria bacterium QH_9_48_43]|jgi:ribonuclease-3|nr:MAG: ribonuclease III [Cyanobacteria bacterium QH_2_48_84]PSO59483.1 MAG: ribonuclease III [Cyanobacteria bacterium QH_10_48_56]PSO67368.1 MAG: ribonuclease III [Cyanobacteria bacterium QH_7_48_89]PSO71921.1 MAG: ribonuclease III [Cyanobacteria bacterium QH_3_48_40]PSO80710.1 MAG: ribonuclease III [Cyanobacteria bacterium QH_9_48_43]PSO83978.1 MAG: ribonuclease III [Cyanobacteria bacterium QS_3_48_167]PSO87425.1 MAG: ribonuclease III [Cyanobacteria bacterium QS_5_48_63]PSO96315.1 MAG: rib